MINVSETMWGFLQCPVIKKEFKEDKIRRDVSGAKR
jgi:hypothetical protein